MRHWDRHRLRRAAAAILAAGIQAADPGLLVRRALACRGRTLRVGGRRYALGRGRLALVAVGKAASRMAHAAEGVLGDALDVGVAVDTSAQAGLARTRLHIASHPLPDARGEAAAAEVEGLARSLGRGDTLLVLLSGGASALLPAPVAGLSLADKIATTSRLLRAGATIQELNTVRKHLSRLKGGGLSQAASPARVIALVLSDVIGDDLATVASGMTTPDPTTYADAARILHARGVWPDLPAAVRAHIERGRKGDVPETAKPGAPEFRRLSTRLIGGNRLSLAAAAAAARRRGFRTRVLPSPLEGEAREAGRVLTAILRDCLERRHPTAPPICLLAGGETTVTVRGAGCGGRNQELVLATASALASFPVPVVVASLGTDGIDGTSSAAGAVADETTLERAAALGLAPPAVHLDANDSNAFFGPLADLIVTGPTGTNVADLTVLLAGARTRPPLRL